MLVNPIGRPYVVQTTWANLIANYPSSNFAVGSQAFVTDVGLNGSVFVASSSRWENISTNASNVTYNTTTVQEALRVQRSRSDMNWLLSNRRISNHLSGMTSAKTYDVPTITTGSLVPSGNDFVSSDLLGELAPISTVSLVDLGASRKVVVNTGYLHGIKTNDKLLIAGTFNDANYYGTRTVTVTSATTFEWNIGGAYPPAPTYTNPTWQYYGFMTHPQNPAFKYSLPVEKMTTRKTPFWANGAASYYPPSVKSSDSSLSYSVEFILEDSVMEIYGDGGGGNLATHRVWEDGFLISDTLKGGSSYNSYPGSMTRYTWAKTKIRHIRIEFAGTIGFFGIGSLSRNAVKPPPINKAPRVLIIGDSFVEGTGQYTRLMGLVDFLAYKLGWNIINMGSGGTGITTNGGIPGRYNYMDRLNEDVISYNPDLILIWGSINDGGNITTQAAGAIFDAIKNALPNTKLIGFGPCCPTVSVPPLLVASGTNLKSACDTRGIPYIDGGIGVTSNTLWLNNSNIKAYYNGTAAVASATVVANAVSSISVSNQGDGYEWLKTPSVTLSGGGGAGAAATAVMNSYVADIVILNGGTGYTSPPTVTLSNEATAMSNLAGSVVASLIVLNNGEGYTTPPSVTLSGGGGTGAAGYAEISGGRVVNIVLTNGGTGYTSAPTVTLVDNPNATQQPTATAVLTNGVVSSITIDTAGGMLSNTPVVSFSGGGGTGAKAVAFLTSKVSSVTVTNGGAGYTSAPTVTIPHPTDNDVTHPKTTGHQMLAIRIASQIEMLG